ncbi:hypothetical protein LLG95_16910 [bacterium]|nr:hypothetical protein [bacterium]
MKMTYLRGNIIGLAMLVAICVAGCNKQQTAPPEPKSDNVRENIVSETPATPAATPAATSAAAATESAPAATGAANLLKDPTFGDVSVRPADSEPSSFWVIRFDGNPKTREHGVESVKLPNGQSAQAVYVTTDVGAMIYTSLNDKIAIDPAKTYRCSIWMRQEPAKIGQRFFGVYGINNLGARVELITHENTKNDNPYFWQGSPDDGQWHQIVGYVFGADTPVPFPKKDDASGVNFKSTPDTAGLIIRMLNYDNQGQPLRVWFALPVVEEAK